MSSGFALPKFTRWEAKQQSDETRRLARISTEAPRIPWEKFRAELRWKAGEHFSLIGPTGMGKTTMLLNVLPMHPYVVVFATKPRDRTMDALIASGEYVRLEKWENLDPIQFPRRVLWPDATRIDSDAYQRAVFADAFARIYREGNWTVALDETWYVDNILKLGKSVEVYLLQARSLDISLVSAFQRPAWVPRALYSSSTHLMFWGTNDEEDIKSLSGVGARSADLIRDLVANLEPFQVLYVNTRTGLMRRTRCPEPAIRATGGKEVNAK